MTTKTTPRHRKIAKAFAADAKARRSRDPIWAAIEAHRTQYIQTAKVGRVASATSAHSPRYAAANAASSIEWGKFERASARLYKVRPKTKAGLLALMAYVECFNTGAYRPCAGWPSGPTIWPGSDDEDSFGFRVLSNVHRAIEAMAQS